MAYVDGFVIAVPKKKIAAYRRMSQKAGKVWRDHGALEYRETVGDELDGGGMGLGFLKGIKAKRGETVVFSWIYYKSKAHRNRVNAAAMMDPRIANFDPKTLPFDPKRMLWGGFKVIVDM